MTALDGIGGVDAGLTWFIDECLYVKGHVTLSGWGFPVREIGYLRPDGEYRALKGHGLASPDVEELHGEAARDSRFALSIMLDAPAVGEQVTLVFTLHDGSRVNIVHVINWGVEKEPNQLLQVKFFSMLESLREGSVIELGARARSGVKRRELVPDRLRYVGFDIVKGDNVDVVGDAHALSEQFGPDSFDALFALSVFEHLVMPWKVALEMNRILKPGAIVLIVTHQTWPLHDTPWDFWRFSDQAWRGLFNESTGFKILETALGERASVVPHRFHPVTAGLDSQPAFLGSAVLCRKIGETRLSWDVDSRRVLSGDYPA